MLVPLTWSVARTLWQRDVGVDAIALVAMASALATGEYLAGAVVAVMLAGGNALEEYAAGRARRELTKLLERAPRVARRRHNGAVEEVSVDTLRPGDIVVVRAGEVIPVDGVAMHEALVDEAALTGEPLPVSYAVGGELRSGSANAGEAFDVRATRLAAESTYAAIVRLVRGAETQRAPFVRLADRYAAFFLPLALGIAGIAWAASGDVVRFVAVMVVATPCPLILAAPIALIAGVSRAARRGVIVKGSGVIEKLGKARTVLFDKTGTLTLGQPALERVIAFDGIGPDELLRLAASVDQLSVHVLAEALVHEAQKRGFELASPAHVEEGRGQGIEGRVDGRSVAVGSSTWLRERGYSGAEGAARALDTNDDLGKAKILVGVDGQLAGAVVMGDSLREDTHELVGRLRAVGVRHIAVVTGDRSAVAEEVGRQLGVDRVYAERSPEGKLDVVRALREQRDLTPVVMVGDGINDAPALALADVGIAMGAAGATVASETADAVIMRDRIDGVVEAIQIGRRSLAIARQSMIAGIGLSLVAMAFAAAGLITPVAGALLQEAIDVAVIVNALRALHA
jgi:heavy metal translocating P-type ATPase